MVVYNLWFCHLCLGDRPRIVATALLNNFKLKNQFEFMSKSLCIKWALAKFERVVVIFYARASLVNAVFSKAFCKPVSEKYHKTYLFVKCYL